MSSQAALIINSAWHPTRVEYKDETLQQEIISIYKFCINITTVTERLYCIVDTQEKSTEYQEQ
jgi:hypothetical protein